MTARSTRNKMKWQTEKVMSHLDKCQGHLKLLSDLSQGQSEYIEKHIADLVTSIELMKAIVKSFREGL